MNALIINSGLGHRMGVLTSEHPKCMTEISHKNTILSRQLKQIQSQIVLSLPAKKRLWQSIVQQKIRNQARCLEYLERPRASELHSMANDVRSGDPENYEAMAAARYFPVLFGTGFSRGEECVTNAALNYGYAILRGAIARNLVVHGLEPCRGIFHHSELNFMKIVCEPRSHHTGRFACWLSRKNSITASGFCLGGRRYTMNRKARILS